MRPPILALLAVASLSSVPARADRIDDVIQTEMKKRNIPGLSLAVVQDGKIVKATGYGTTELGGTTPVAATTLFQAGSISKPVSALAALRMVERGQLALDEDVNVRLVGWKVPDTELTRDNKVTLRRILSHTAGLTVHGFPGYAVGEPVPTLVQILDGEKPANTAPIRVDVVPGTIQRYSGGGYIVLQKLMGDVTKRPFPELMRKLVLEPAGMTHSTYAQPLPLDRAAATASGFYADRSPVPGRWHVYPEMSAAGLWTTPSDLAMFAIEVQRALAGKSRKVVSPAMARRFVTEEKEHAGLGIFLEGTGRTLRFSHNGRDEGFDAFLVACAETGQAAAIMINANDNSRAAQRILDAIAREYRWPADGQPQPAAPAAVAVAPAALERYAGRYEFSNNNMWTFMVHEGRLYTQADGLPDDELVPVAADRFRTTDGALEIAFLGDAGATTGFAWTRGDKKGTAPRIGPLIHTFAPRADPDAALTGKVEAAIVAFAQGRNDAPELAAFSAGLRRDLRGPYRPLDGLASLKFIAAEDIAARGIERHDGKVARLVYYQRVPDGRPRYVLVHVTVDGIVTDLDLVDD